MKKTCNNCEFYQGFCMIEKTPTEANEYCNEWELSFAHYEELQIRAKAMSQKAMERINNRKRAKAISEPN